MLFGFFHFMIDVGLHFVTLGRSSDTLSGGEAQRTQLAKQVRSEERRVGKECRYRGFGRGGL